MTHNELTPEQEARKDRVLEMATEFFIPHIDEAKHLVLLDEVILVATGADMKTGQDVLFWFGATEDETFLDYVANGIVRGIEALTEE